MCGSLKNLHGIFPLNQRLSVLEEGSLNYKNVIYDVKKIWVLLRTIY